MIQGLCNSTGRRFVSPKSPLYNTIARSAPLNSLASSAQQSQTSEAGARWGVPSVFKIDPAFRVIGMSCRSESVFHYELC